MADPNEPQPPTFQFETTGVHAGLTRSDNTTQDAPIYASTSFVFNDSAHGAAIFGMNAESFCYSRIGNPTTDVFEKRMAALENGAAALAASSGQAALFMTITALASAGDNIIITSSISESSSQQFKYRLSTLNVETRFIESGDVELIRQAIDSNTKGVFVESISSDLVISDIESLATIAHEAGIPLIADNTSGAAGYLIRPIDHGADIAIASSSQYISISGSPGAGIIIDSGKFPWSSHQSRFPQFFTPAPGFHGLKLYEKFGTTVFITFARIAVLRDIGPCLNPFESFQLLAGLETLGVRVERMCGNAGKLVGWLAGHGKVEDVRYPGWESKHAGEMRTKYLKRGAGGLLSFTLKRGVVVDFGGSNVVSIGQSLGGSKTTLLEKQLTGDSQRVMHVSVGLENIDDIIADFEQVLLGS